MPRLKRNAVLNLFLTAVMVGAIALFGRTLLTAADPDPIAEVKLPSGSRYSTPTPPIAGETPGDPYAEFSRLDASPEVRAAVDALLRSDVESLMASTNHETYVCTKGSERTGGLCRDAELPDGTEVEVDTILMGASGHVLIDNARARLEALLTDNHVEMTLLGTQEGVLFVGVSFEGREMVPYDGGRIVSAIVLAIDPSSATPVLDIHHIASTPLSFWRSINGTPEELIALAPVLLEAERAANDADRTAIHSAWSTAQVPTRQP